MNKPYMVHNKDLALKEIQSYIKSKFMVNKKDMINHFLGIPYLWPSYMFYEYLKELEDTKKIKVTGDIIEAL